MAITVLTDIPYGNACDIEIDGESVSFAADPHGGPESLWFCFRVDTGGHAGSIKLVLKHAETMLGVGRPYGIRPVVRPDGGDWERTGPAETDPQPDGRAFMHWTIDAPATFVDVALCYPYGTPDVDALVADCGGFYRADAIGVSQGSRPIVRLSNDGGEPDGSRPGLYLSARQHSGETSGSWVLDGLLRHIASLGDAAPLVWCVPLTNIDGVEGGDYGKDNFPYDLNRAWGQPPMRHETLVIGRDMRRWMKRCRPTLGLDFHAPGGTEHEGIYTFVPKPERLPIKNAEANAWCVVMEEKLTPELTRKDFARVARYGSRWETPGFTRYCCETLDFCGFTYEIPYAMINETVLTREVYREAGKRIAEAIVEKIERDHAS